MRAISPAKRDLPIGKGNKAVVGNGNTMGVPSQIPKYIFRAAEGPFAVNGPFVAEQSSDKGAKGLRVGKVLQLAVKLDFAFGESLLEGLSELGSKYSLQHLFRQKEAIGRIHGDPALVIER